MKYDEVNDISQFASEMFDSLQKDSTKCAPQYNLNIFVTIAAYWVPDLPNIKGFLATFGISFHTALLTHTKKEHCVTF